VARSTAHRPHAVRSTRAALSPRALAPAAAALAVFVAVACGGASRADRSSLDGVPACPRDAAQDASGRCACADGTIAVFGACVAPAAGDAYCGSGALMTGGGCAFRPCAANESVDIGSGTCVSRSALANLGEPCVAPALDVIANGRRACVVADAACPRGTRRQGNACVGLTRCPPGSLPEGSACRPVVVEDPRSGRRRVDVGAWSMLALGVDGGTGSPEVCRPMQLRPQAFDGAQGEVVVRLGLVIPDEDVTRLHADVDVSDGAGRRLPSAEAQGVARSAVSSVLELLRGLGGESTAAAVTLEFRCAVTVAPREVRAGDGGGAEGASPAAAAGGGGASKETPEEP
jgi:hypothetical protein